MQNKTNEIAQKQEGSVVIACKVRREIGEKIFNIAKEADMNNNIILGNMCEVIVRYMSPEHNMTADIERCMSLFEHLTGWSDAVRLTDPKAKFNIDRAVYFLTAEGRKGFVPVMVSRPFFGEWKQDYNIVHIFERMCEAMLPERYRRMKSISAEMGCNSILEMMDILIDERTNEREMAEFRKPFEDNDRSDYGRKPVQAPYRRKHRKNPDSPSLFRNNKD